MLRGFGAVAAIVFVLLGAVAPAEAAKLTIVGDVTYRERIALPPEATLSVRLVDLAAPEAEGPAATAAIASPGQVPLTFTLNIDDTSVRADHAYGLVAEIMVADGTVWFRNAEPYAIDPAAPAGPILIVVNFQGTIATPAPKAPILDITWQAESIGGVAVLRGPGPSLSIAPDMRAGGRGGCNSWFAQVAVNGEGLAFSAVAATRMACLSDEMNTQEQSYFAALAATRFWRLRDDKLVLVDAAGSDLAVFGRSRF